MEVRAVVRGEISYIWRGETEEKKTLVGSLWFFSLCVGGVLSSNAFLRRATISGK